MPVCRNCGVQLDEGSARCPLCQASLLEGEVEKREDSTVPEAAGRVSRGHSAPLTRLRLWEIVSLFAGAGAAAVLVADRAGRGLRRPGFRPGAGLEGPVFRFASRRAGVCRPVRGDAR